MASELSEQALMVALEISATGRAYVTVRNIARMKFSCLPLHWFYFPSSEVVPVMSISSI